MPESVTTRIDARSLQLFERDQGRAADAIVEISLGFAPIRAPWLAPARAAGLEIVGAPEHHRHRFRQPAIDLHVTVEHARRLARAVLHGKSARNAEGIEAGMLRPVVKARACAGDRRRATA